MLGFNTIYAGSGYDSSFYNVRNYTGTLRSEFSADHSIYRFSFSENSDKFIVSSSDLILYLYSVNTGLIRSYDLNSIAINKYHIRCLDISPDGKYLLFTNVDKIYLMNLDLAIIDSWKVPNEDMPEEEGWEKRELIGSVNRSEIIKNMAVLNLNGNPDYSKIKKNFKSLVLKYHPDQNHDPQSEEKIKEIITAYEYLTKENAKGTLAEFGVDKYYYYKVMSQTKYEVPNTDLSFTLEIGMGSGIKEDWIYSTYLGLNGEELYLGCYSGKIYCLSIDGIVKKIYNCHDVVKSIKKRGFYLFIETNYYLFILKNDEYVNYIKIWKQGDLFWYNGGFFLKTSNELRLFSNNGDLISILTFKNRIYDLYITNKGLNISTTNRTYEIFIDKMDEPIVDDVNIPCTYCGTKNLYYSIFCQECGKPIKLDLAPKNEDKLKRKSDIFCPYCKGNLKTEPKRKKKCPHCKNFIYVRTSPSTRQKVLVTEDGVKEIEKEWRGISNRNSCLRNLEGYGINERSFKLRKNEISQQSNSEPDDVEVILSIYNDLIQKNNDLQTLKMINYQIALYLNSEGRNYLKIRQESSKAELLYYQSLGVEKVEIMTVGDQACENCKKLKNKIFRVSDALEIMPVPCKDCAFQLYNENYGFCRCYYSPKYR